MHAFDELDDAADDWQSSAEGVQEALDQMTKKREEHQALTRTKGGDL